MYARPLESPDPRTMGLSDPPPPLVGALNVPHPWVRKRHRIFDVIYSDWSTYICKGRVEGWEGGVKGGIWPFGATVL